MRRQVGMLLVAGVAMLAWSCSDDSDGGGASTTAAPADTTLPDVVAGDPASLSGLRVLITNDDGVQPETGLGAFALRHALCNAGADVVVVAPWDQQSGASAQITFGGEFTVTTPAIDASFGGDCASAPSSGVVHGVCLAGPSCTADSPSATPGDAVSLGLNAVVGETLGWADGPDVVLSGINDGGNDGLNIPLSGTIGAATWASIYGAPTLALSASGATPESLADSADWTVGLLAALVTNDALPQGYLLNVGFPRPDDGPVSGVQWTTSADVTWGGTLYERQGDTYVSSYGECSYASCGFAPDGTDSAALAAGSIAVTPLGVNRTIGLAPDTATAQAVVASLAG